MKKSFNDTGTCFPEKHYMADTSKKIRKILELINAGSYFLINRPRQYGKTTTLRIIKKQLENMVWRGLPQSGNRADKRVYGKGSL